MSELKAYWITTRSGNSLHCYLKSEADKVIAELKDKALQYKVLDKEHCRDLNTQERLFALQIAHHKRKRCLAMAEWCNSEMGRETFACFRSRNTKEVWREEHKYWAKWRKIWFKLSIKFKDGK